MIVTCEGCKARFKFDETRIKPQGIKVHCSKCRHTFVLKPVARAADPPVIRTGPPEKPLAPAPGAPASALAGDGAAPDPPDDPLADVPGFEPESRPGPSPEEEEKKALAGLAQDERVDASVGEALGLFQASEETEAAESGDAAET
ncbi:MAG: zinc-ribbon domain-containing protein, partial [Myxococcota bacterium]